jgi:dipeptidyl aminopeptidase/acylaminoacyl peptidase
LVSRCGADLSRRSEIRGPRLGAAARSADQRVPTFQGREFFEALAARGKVVRMVTYPGSGHFPSLWQQRRDVFREVAAWLGKYVGG